MRLSPGSIISGTLRLDDLLREFAHVLALHKHDGNKGVIDDALVMAKTNSSAWTDEQIDDAQMLIDALSKRLDDLCPNGYYFGAHPNDGADFGVWEHEDAYEGEGNVQIHL